MANKKDKHVQSNEPEMELMFRHNSMNGGKPNFSRVSQIYSDGVRWSHRKRKQQCDSSNLINILHHVPFSTNIKLCIIRMCTNGF